ncbi:hypothetical protein [Comamonas sp. 26]|uniref:hypothetical protein n=1 Tax=Comamonas sp. 26 TaxID=2035201 RepID=UPI000C18491A|nr:hypothetical protein [Comamonas sp. 26]PIF98314.1 hypothetical protein CLU84_3793 [Comamonas sp. 26]
MEAKITANKLGEYLTASARRRRSIIKTIQEEGGFPAMHYTDARNAICDYLSGNISSQQLLEKSIELKNYVSDNNFSQSTKNASGAAIEDFIELEDEIVVKNCLIRKGSDFQENSIEISGVKVGAKPDLMLLSADTEEVVGCIKFHFSQSASLEKDSAEYTATIMKKHLEDNYTGGNKIDPKKILIIDNPTGEIYEAPKSTKSRLKDIEAGCEEIFARWEI